MEESGWQEQGGGEIMKWEEGTTLTGTYRGMQPARNEDSSPIITVETADGVVKAWSPTVLCSRLEDVEKGDEVFIRCLGQTIKVKRGQNAFDFQVFKK